MAKLKPRLPVAGLDASADQVSARQREVGGGFDPRWLLTGRPKLQPAMAYLLMAGEPADVRSCGWVAVAQAGQFGEPTPDVMWEA